MPGGCRSRGSKILVGRGARVGDPAGGRVPRSPCWKDWLRSRCQRHRGSSRESLQVFGRQVVGSPPTRPIRRGNQSMRLFVNVRVGKWQRRASIFNRSKSHGAGWASLPDRSRGKGVDSCTTLGYETSRAATGCFDDEQTAGVSGDGSDGGEFCSLTGHDSHGSTLPPPASDNGASGRTA